MRPQSISLKGDPPPASVSASFARARRHGDLLDLLLNADAATAQHECSRAVVEQRSNGSSDVSDCTARTPRTSAHIAHSHETKSPPPAQPKTRQRALVSLSSPPRRSGSTRWAIWPLTSRPSHLHQPPASGRLGPSANFQPSSGRLRELRSLRRVDLSVDQVGPGDVGEIGSHKPRW